MVSFPTACKEEEELTMRHCPVRKALLEQEGNI